MIDIKDRTPVLFRSDVTVDNTDHMGGDEAVIQAMLVSTDDAILVEEMLEQKTTFGRINFLMRNRHGTPFEHAALKFYVEAPIVVFREWHRHRIGWSYNERSGRYSQLDPVYYVFGPDRPLIQVGKPGAYSFIPADQELHNWLVEDMKEEARDNYAHYEERLARGVAKEAARFSLGINIYSAMFATCNPRSLMSYLSLRTKEEDSKFPSYPMWEIEICARAAEETLGKLFPLTYQSFNENGRVAP